MLTETDPFALAVIQAVVQRALDFQDVRDQNLAVRITNGFGRVMSQMFGKRNG